VHFTILVGAGSYELDGQATAWLEDRIRSALLDDAGRPAASDASVRACVQLADVIAEDRERGSSPEPVEVGMLHAEGLCAYVLRPQELSDDSELSALFEALRRFRRSPYQEAWRNDGRNALRRRTLLL
jgi:hypothetical protein